MSFRRLILKRLNHFYEGAGSAEGGYLLLDPVDIVGRPLPGRRGERYAAAINQLLRERLIVGAAIGGGKGGFSLNPDKLDDIRKELHWWRNQAIIVVASTLIALAGLIWAVLRFFLER